MAAQEIGSLFVALGLDSAAFSAGVKNVLGMTARVQKGLEGMADRVEAVGKRLSVVSAGMAAVGLAVGGLVKNTASAASEASKQAEIANAGFEEFQRWAKGADKVGIGQEKLADILKDVNDRVGDFLQTGGGPMADFFENVAPKVGVTAEQFRNLSGPQALQLYVSSLEKAGLSQQEMTFYMEAMASDATALIPLLQNGGAEMTYWGDAAASAGAIMSERLKGMTGEFSDKIRLLSLSFEGLQYRLAEALLPVVNRFIDAMMIYGVPALNAMVAALEGLIQWFGNLSEPVQLAAAGIAAALGVGGPIMLAIAVLTRAVAAMMTPAGAIGLFIGAAAVIYTNWEPIKTFFSKLWDGVSAAASAAWAAIDQAMTDSVLWIGQKQTEIEQFFINGWNAILEYLRGLPAKFIEIGGQIVDGLKAGIAAKWDSLVSWFTSEGDNLTEKFEENYDINSPSRVFREIGQFITEGLGLGLKDGVPGVQSAMAGVTDAVQLAGVEDGLFKFRDAARDVFSQVAFQGQKLGDVLRNRLASWASNAAGNLFTSAFNTLWGGLGLPSFANGTDYFAGGLARINERGGEIVNLPSGAQVIPHDVSMRMADRAGSADRLHVTVAMDESTGGLYAMAQDAAGREIARAAPVIVRESVKASAAASRATKGTMGVR